MRQRKRAKPLRPLRRSDWLFLAVVPLVLIAVWTQRSPLRQLLGSRATQDLRVIRVIDGDTIVLSDGRTVRYIGIDTPERGQPYYEAATNFNRKLVLGKQVELELDVERYDHYGRLLAYVFVRDARGNRIFVNAAMVRNGFARVYTKPPNVRYADLLVRLQEEARENRRGLWAVYAPTRSPVIGNRRTLTFHRPTCPSVQRISAENRIRFPSAAAALQKGYHPCRECQP